MFGLEIAAAIVGIFFLARFSYQWYRNHSSSKSREENEMSLTAGEMVIEKKQVEAPPKLEPDHHDKIGLVDDDIPASAAIITQATPPTSPLLPIQEEHGNLSGLGLLLSGLPVGSRVHISNLKLTASNLSSLIQTNVSTGAKTEVEASFKTDDNALFGFAAKAGASLWDKITNWFSSRKNKADEELNEETVVKSEQKVERRDSATDTNDDLEAESATTEKDDADESLINFNNIGEEPTAVPPACAVAKNKELNLINFEIAPVPTQIINLTSPVTPLLARSCAAEIGTTTHPNDVHFTAAGGGLVLMGEPSLVPA